MKKILFCWGIILGFSQYLPLAHASLQVVVSIPPQVYFVKQIGGNFVDVMCMLSEGGSPHTYEPTAQQMKFLSKADVYVRIKIDFENAWWEKIIATNSDMHIVDSTHDIEFIDGNMHHHEDHNEETSSHDKWDPHIWLSPRLVQIQAEHIYQGLVTADPEHQDIYKANKEAFVRSLKVLDNKIGAKFAKIKNRHFMVFHPVWSYFAKDYNLEQISIEFEGKKPSAKEMMELMQIAKQKQIKVIFLQPQASRRTTDIIAKQIGAKVKILDPLAPQWLENIHFVVDAFTEALSQ